MDRPLHLLSPMRHRPHKKAAFTLVCALTALSLMTLPFGKQAGLVVSPFLPICLTAVCVVELITSYLLFSQFRLARRFPLAILAGTYLFSGLIIIPHILTFPGVFSETGLFGAGPQTAAWLWVVWHSGFPAGILLYLLVEKRFRQIHLDNRQMRRIIVAFFAGVPAAIAVIFGLLLLCEPVLPTLIEQDHYRELITTGVGPMVAVINLLAVIGIGYRLKTWKILHIWLFVAVFASLLDVVVMLFAESRYSIGWYVARMNTLVSAAAVLGALLHQATILFERLVESEQKIKRLAYEDPLTGLANRRMWEQRMEDAVSRAQERHRSLAVLYLDLDGFKQINDQWGHDVGDLLLKEVAVRLSRLLPASATLARIGGDEFNLLLPDVTAKEAEAMARSIVRAFEDVFPLGDHQAEVTASIGIALYPEDGGDVKTLAKAADQAMYKAKEAGKNGYAFHRQLLLSRST